MKTALVLAALLVSSLANAQATPQPLPGQPVPELKPIRMATAHFIVHKLTFSPSPNGANSSNEEVCTKDVSVPVFDFRGYTNGYSYEVPTETCASSLGGQPINVVLSGMIAFSPGDNVGMPGDIKRFGGSLFLDEPISSPGNHSSSSQAWSHDLTTKSMGLDLIPQMGTSCQTSGTEPVHPKLLMKSLADDPVCTVTGGEYFIGSVELTDSI